MIFLKNKKGSILLLSLWILTLLSLFAVHIGLRVRKRIALISKIEKKSQLHFIAESGVKRAISAILLDLERNKEVYSPYGKFYRHNNNEKFSNINIGVGINEVSYKYYDSSFDRPEKRYGFVDEERKLNVNVVPLTILKRLFEDILTIGPEEASDLAEAIVDWRLVGSSEPTGFYSDDYYANLQFPYPLKDSEYEVLDELMLVKGISKEIFHRITPFITIYGDGKINVNTASKEVLLALGMDIALVDKILLVRRGYDGIEATVDDFVFLRPHDIASDLKKYIKLDLNEIKQIDFLNSAGQIKTNSSFYFIRSKASFANGNRELIAKCVYNSAENRIEYWSEK